MALEEYYDFRGKLVEELALDLIGPTSGADETINDPPITRYVLGVLYPQSAETIDPSQDIDHADDADETTAADPPVALANRRYPSSMGMTFAVDAGSTQHIAIRMTAAAYEELPDENGEKRKRRSDSPGQWKRHAAAIEPLSLDVDVPIADRRLAVAEGLELFCRVRRADVSGAVPVTLVLLNTQKDSRESGERDARSFFQVGIEVSADVPDGAFVERPTSDVAGDDEDIDAYRLLYRYAREFAVGHGCSVQWELAPGDGERAQSIRTTFAPQAEVPLIDSNPQIRSEALGMRFLTTTTRANCLRALREFCDDYGRWLEARRGEADQLNSALQPTARLHLERCSDALRRMRLGIDVLNSDDAAWKAFGYANAALLQQRSRTEWLRGGKPTAKPVEDERAAWRPFQLAFILQCLEGIARPQSKDRDLADLLWFPTGGGKTEAYLGLIAFTVFLRRLRRGAQSGGVTALMRYTLRLLTIQQFERATLLICCCELIRVKEGLGGDPISIGLWVGQGSTPNTLKAARTALNKLQRNEPVAESNPVQLFACPWCGAQLDDSNYSIRKAPNEKLIIGCRTAGCDFKDELPVYVVDEDIYHYRPTLIIATVDKFASLPWREEAADLFNLRPGSEAARPELIIQDELHLISGPLGTLAGLYETAIDLLCTQDGIRPKVIASTATIRRAREQARALFNREVRQFPPPGLDARDSYFAVQVPPESRGSRLFVGLCAPGTSHTTLLVRAYAALLQKAHELPAQAAVKDPYWTLTGYFNSLRVLGGARMQVQDDVGDRMALLATQSGLPQRDLENSIVELTSREQSSKIPEHLKQMAVALPDLRTSNVILATNMISVGVDIDRLGLMVVMGQPQSTSEYIQATSRVGRRLPGLIVVLFNSARSRDRSHYESFAAYHSALYRQVEATSVTPYSARARDRGLHAVLIALARLRIPALRHNDDAANVAARATELSGIQAAILERVRDMAPGEEEGTRTQLTEIVKVWESRVRGPNGLKYWDTKSPADGLLIEASDDSDEEFKTLWSLRDVDKESGLRIVNLERGRGR